MIVVDASVVIETLLRTPMADAVDRRLFSPGQTLHAPHLMDIEVAQVLRRYAASGAIPARRAHVALTDLGNLSIRRYPHDLLLERVWALRHNLTAYDAAYVALAEALDAVLLTRDRRLVRVSGVRAQIEVM